MSPFISDLSIPWIREEAGHGNFVLFAFIHDDVHLLAPPGARVHPDERHRERACWRYAIWEHDLNQGPPAISVDLPSSISELGSAEVIELLPVKFHDFVKDEMARQLCRATTFGEPPIGRAPFDRHAQLAGRTRAWVSSELTSAFPEEDWYSLDYVVLHIPRTVEELLRKMPPGEEPTSIEIVTRWTRGWRKLSRIPGGVTWAVVLLAHALWSIGRIGRWPRKADRRLLDKPYEIPDTSPR